MTALGDCEKIGTGRLASAEILQKTTPLLGASLIFSQPLGATGLFALCLSSRSAWYIVDNRNKSGTLKTV